MKISDEILETRGSEVENLYALSQLMNTGLDRRVISILLELLELGVHPNSLVAGKLLADTDFYFTFISCINNSSHIQTFWY